jgi:preprotein translocase subunit YajC
MKKENLMQYVLLMLIAFIVVIGLINSFKTSRNLKDATKSLKEASQKVDNSMKLITDQGLIIDSIRSSNVKLLNDINTMEKGYNQIRGVINSRFIKTFFYLDSIKNKVDSLTIKQGPIE